MFSNNLNNNELKFTPTFGTQLPDGASFVGTIKSFITSLPYINYTRDYRNTIIHAGFISIKEDIINRKIYIQDDPKTAPTFTNHVDMQDYMVVTFSELVCLVEYVYSIFLKDASMGVI